MHSSSWDGVGGNIGVEAIRVESDGTAGSARGARAAGHADPGTLCSRAISSAGSSRDSGCLSSACTNASAATSIGKPGTRVSGRGTGCTQWAAIIAIGESARIGRRPTSASYAMTAKLYASERGSGSAPWLTSGGK